MLISWPWHTIDHVTEVFKTFVLWYYTLCGDSSYIYIYIFFNSVVSSTYSYTYIIYYTYFPGSFQCFLIYLVSGTWRNVSVSSTQRPCEQWRHEISPLNMSGSSYYSLLKCSIVPWRISDSFNCIFLIVTGKFNRRLGFIVSK